MKFLKNIQFFKMNAKQYISFGFLSVFLHLAQAQTPIFVGNSKQFLALWQSDGYLLASQNGFLVTQNPSKKLGVVIPNAENWEKKELIMPVVAPNTGLDSNTYTVFARASWDTLFPKIDGWRDYLAAYTTSNGIDFARPNLGLVAFGQSTNTNLMFHKGFSVPFYEPNSPPNQRWQRLRRYYDATAGGYGGGAVGLEYAATPTGSYQPFYTPVSITRTLDSYNQAYFDAKTNKYVAYVRSWQHNGTLSGFSFQVNNAKGFERFGRCVTRIELSPQQYFGSWGAPAGWDLFANTHLVIDAADSSADHKTVLKPINNHTDNYIAGFTPYQEALQNGYPQAFFMFSTMFDARAVRFVGCYMAVSRDNKNWHYPNQNQPYVPLSAQNGNGDAGNLIMGVGYIRAGNDILQYYSATDVNDQSHGLPNSQIFATKQRLDGFVSVDAGTNAELTTQTVQTSSPFLFVNAEPTNSNGEMLVEIRDQNNQPISGFSLSDALPIRTDGTSQQVRWKNNQSIEKLLNQPIKLHIKAKFMKIYAFQFEENGKILPFSFEKITANRINNNKDVLVNYQTLWEQPVEKYQLQRRLNAGNYQTIDTKKANDISHNNYVFLDMGLKSDSLYQTAESNVLRYRVKINYLNGTTEYSDSALVLNLDVNTNHAKVEMYPNPAQNRLYIDVTQVVNGGDSLQLLLTDARGKQVLVQPLRNQLKNEINTQNLQSGSYVAQILNKNQDIVFTQKIILVK